MIIVFLLDTDLSQSVEVLTTEDIQHATVAVSLERKGIYLFYFYAPFCIYLGSVLTV